MCCNFKRLNVFPKNSRGASHLHTSFLCGSSSTCEIRDPTSMDTNPHPIYLRKGQGSDNVSVGSTTNESVKGGDRRRLLVGRLVYSSSGFGTDAAQYVVVGGVVTKPQREGGDQWHIRRYQYKRHLCQNHLEQTRKWFGTMRPLSKVSEIFEIRSGSVYVLTHSI